MRDKWNLLFIVFAKIIAATRLTNKRKLILSGRYNFTNKWQLNFNINFPWIRLEDSSSNANPSKIVKKKKTKKVFFKG